MYAYARKGKLKTKPFSSDGTLLLNGENKSSAQKNHGLIFAGSEATEACQRSVSSIASHHHFEYEDFLTKKSPLSDEARATVDILFTTKWRTVRRGASFQFHCEIKTALHNRKQSYKPTYT